MRKILCLLAVLFSFRAEAQIAAVVGHTYSAPGATIVARNVVNTPASNVMYVGTTYEYPATSTTNDQYGISGGDTSYVIYLPFGFSGTIFPFPGQAPMSPASYTVKGLTNFFTADFTASVASVSGTIRGTNGVPLAGVPINFSPVSGSDFSQISTPAGAYGFALTNGWSGTVTPVPLFGKSFVPPSVTVTSLGTNKVVNFNLGGDFVYGYVSNTFTSYGVDGVLIKFVGATNFSTTTTNGGLYGILLPYGWVGAITPSMSNGYFSPVAVSTTIMDIATLNFAYTVLTPLIAGRVTSMIAPQQGIANVPMVFSDGVIVYTDSNGYYFRNVNAGFTGTVVPTARPLIFFPAVTPYANVVKNMSNRNFTWVPDGYTYVDPMAFLTHRQTSSQNLYTLARADQGVVLSNRMLVATSTNIQEDLVLLDAGLSTAVSNVLFQRSYTAGLDPSTFWATNWTALWGGFIVNKNLWGEYDATYSNVNVTGNIQAPVIQTGTFSNLVAVNVYGWVDATPRSLLPQTNGSWVAAPPYTNVDAGFYTVDFALIGALTGGFPNPLTYVTNYVTNLVVTDYRDDYNYAPALQVGSLFYGSDSSSTWVSYDYPGQWSIRNFSSWVAYPPFGFWLGQTVPSLSAAGVYAQTYPFIFHLTVGLITNYTVTIITNSPPPVVLSLVMSLPSTNFSTLVSSTVQLTEPLFPQSIRATVYLDEGAVVIPVLSLSTSSTNEITPSIYAVESIRMRSTMQPPTSIWK